MLQGNYEQIVKMISEGSGVSIEEVERKIEAKRAKLSGLISKEGASQIIASELGVNFEKQKMKISGLMGGMRRVNITGKIIRMNKVIEYNKNGKSGKIGSFVMADDSGNIRVVLWDSNHIGLIEKGEIKDGDVVEIANADIRNNELHLSTFGEIKLSGQVIENVQTKMTVTPKNIADIRINDNVSLRAFIVQMFGPTFFSVCPQCGKKVGENSTCEKDGIVTPKQNAILTLILDDGTESVRALLFGDQIKKLINEENIPPTEAFMPYREDLLGREILVEGNVRKNKLSEATELFVNVVTELNIDTLISELEK